MSGQSSRPDLPEGLDLSGINGAESSVATTGRRRAGAASVTIRRRDDDDRDGGPSLDPATKSLADALKITYRLLQAAMVVLIGLYVLSGFQSVKESERGIRLTMGRLSARDLPPGFQFSLPAPFGELVKVQTGLQTQEIDKQFFPRLSEHEEKMMVDKDKGTSALAGGTDSLDPDADGHLLTADGNIAHARWSVTYQRSDAGLNASNIDPDSERQIVAAAASRGVVRAAASLTIDDLLRKQVDTSQSSVSSSRIETLARDAAQAALDQIESGIQITDLTMTVAIPPRFVMASFDRVSGAQSQAAKLIETARTERNDKLTQAAGEAAPLLLDMIDDYEAELTRIQQGAGDPSKAAAALDTIDRVLQREEVAIDGQPARVRVSGKVSQIIDDARQYRTSVVNLASGDFQVFKAKKELFDSNPLVMITSDWTQAFTGVLNNEAVQSVFLPEDLARQVLLINRDPRIVRSLEELANRREAEAAQQQRILDRDRKRFTDRMDSQGRQRAE